MLLYVIVFVIVYIVQTLPGLDNVVTRRPAPAGHDGQHPAEHDLLDLPVDQGTGEVDGQEEGHPCQVGGYADQVAQQHPDGPGVEDMICVVFVVIISFTTNLRV